MFQPFSLDRQKKAIPIHLVSADSRYLRRADNFVKQAVKSQKFNAKHGETCFVYDAHGVLSQVLVGQSSTFSMWDIAHLPGTLGKGAYKLDFKWGKSLTKSELDLLYLGWGLGHYENAAYKKSTLEPVILTLDKSCDFEMLKTQTASLFAARDLINMPPNVLTPNQLKDYVVKLTKPYKVKVKTIKDKDLEKKNFPLIHAVGRASEHDSCLIDFTWGDKKHPTVTLVGKGVTFDTGGLDLKPSAYMLLMKKDMGGAAAVLALANMIMATKLPVRLRVLIPAVENALGGRAFRPQDVIKSRKGTTIEIGNTDAEGRLVLADAMTYAMADEPEIMIDFATLTGAGRVALGTDIPALFSNDEMAARQLSDIALQIHDPLWHMPLWHDYIDHLKSDVADMNNSGPGYGGAISAALFLNHFVDAPTKWFHVDLMGWQQKARPGRPVGGDVIGVRAMYEYIKNHVR